MDRGEIIKEILIILVEALVGAMIGFLFGSNVGGSVDDGILFAILCSGLIEGWKVINEFVGTFIGYGAYGLAFAIVLNAVKVIIACCLGFCISVGKIIYLVIKFIVAARKAKREHFNVRDFPIAKKCEKCGNTISADSLFCPECGTQFRTNSSKKRASNIGGLVIVLVIVAGLGISWFLRDGKEKEVDSIIPPQLKQEENMTQEIEEETDVVMQQLDMLRKMLGEQAISDIKEIGQAMFSQTPFSEVSSFFDANQTTLRALQSGYEKEQQDIHAQGGPSNLTLTELNAYFYQNTVQEDGSVQVILSGAWYSKEGEQYTAGERFFYMPLKYKENNHNGSWQLTTMPTLPMYYDSAALGENLNWNELVNVDFDQEISFVRTE